MARRARNTDNNTQEGTEMSFLDEETNETSDAAEDAVVEPSADEATETPAEGETKAKRKRDDLPEGFVTPVGFANALNARTLEQTGTKGEIRPQMIYGYYKNNNANFREAVGSVVHTDGRPILNLEKAFAWWDAKEERKAARATKSAEKAAAAESEPSTDEG